MTVPFLACMAAAAAFYHLPPRVLPSIQAVEGGQPGLVQMNTNQTADLGVMQVNTIWVQPLARYTQLTPLAVMDRLKNDSCFNIATAAAIMRYYLTEAHGDLMVAIGYYHSHTPTLGEEYRQKVIAAAMAMFVRHEPLHTNGTQQAGRWVSRFAMVWLSHSLPATSARDIAPEHRRGGCSPWPCHGIAICHGHR
jgi:hypothetical protein